MRGNAPLAPRRAVRTTLRVVAALALLAGPMALAGSLFDDLKRAAESAVKQKASEAMQPVVVECTAGDQECVRKAERQGNEVRIVQPSPPPAAGPGVNPYLSHPLAGHPAYVLAGQIATAKSEQEAADLMRTAFDRIHLGIYTHEGRQLLAGAERKPTDLFLYDFQWRMLAHAFHQHNDMSYADHGAMLGAGLLSLEDPGPAVTALSQALERRYRKAVQKPDDPMSFIVLLTDGLARQQGVPYSLDETARFTDPRIRVDPLQSALIMLDFFTRPPGKGRKVSFDWLPSLVSTAYAGSPCDMIKGDDEQGYWGRGTDILGEIGQELPGAAGKAIGFIGNATGVAGAIGDLLVLYGMNIKLEPQPYTIHLRHGGEGHVAAIQATVTFDAQGVPDSVLKCGWLAGKQMPPNGGLKDVELTWDFHPELSPLLHMHSEMLRHGSLLTGTAGGLRTTTDAAGMSVFLIEPTDCPSPNGPVRGRDYMASVDARYVTKSIPTPGLLGFGLILKLGPGAIEYLMHGRSAYARFRAEWHEKPPPPRPHYGGSS